VVEIRLDFSKDDGTEFPQKVIDIKSILANNDIIDEEQDFPLQDPGEERSYWYSSLLAQTSLLLQQKYGHRLNYCEVLTLADEKDSIALVEHEDAEVGMAAVQLAIEIFSGINVNQTGALGKFAEMARERILPFETQAIINAAQSRDIPFFQLERAPFPEQFKTKARFRKNGVLVLGNGAAYHLLDGTFCEQRLGSALLSLLDNPNERNAFLRWIEAPAYVDPEDQLSDYRNYQLLLIGGELISAVQERPAGPLAVVDVHPSTLGLAVKINRKLRFAPVEVHLRLRDISLSLSEQGGGFVDINLVPDLDALMLIPEQGPELLTAAAGALLDWLFPDPALARVPIIAVTGTNGKTTTSRMINHIMLASDRKPGMVTTDGMIINGQQISDGDAGAFIGHARILTNEQIDIAVLESHHRGIAIRGFAFNHCDVAVCTNVTEEHLETGHIETVEQMAVLKRALLERASKAAVLFADNKNCMAMLDFITSEKICLVSLTSSVEELKAFLSPGRGCYCVLEEVNSTEFMVFYDLDQRIELLSVNEIPATFDGTAAVNVSNAMHAMAAAYFSGVNVEVMCSAMRGFKAGSEMTPGRMNVVEGLPFHMILDFAHSPDGMQKISEFIDRQDVEGRKIIAFSGLGNRSDELNRKSAQAIAGHFDFYFCKDYEPTNWPRKRYRADFMQQVLLEQGIAPENTVVTTFGRDVIFSILDYCKPGDLLLMLVGHNESTRVPAYIKEYKAMKPAQGAGT
jgi:UDP-N-acetylmuramyl tripeptide synthase